MSRKTKQDWLNAGYELLMQNGPKGLTIDALLKRVGVTKGSFYHHFKGHADYIEHFLNFYEQEGTLNIIDICNEEPTPKARLRKLLVVVTSYPPEAATIMRTWAQHDERVRIVQERADARRLAYVADQFQQMGINEVDAKQYANLLYSILIGSEHMMPPVTGQTQRNLFVYGLRGLGLGIFSSDE